MAKKRILNDFQITAIAAVDRPAQEGATMALMKRAETGGVMLSDEGLAKLNDVLACHNSNVAKTATQSEDGTMHPFENKVAAISKRDSISKTAAWEVAAKEHPDLLADYQVGGGKTSTVAKAHDQIRKEDFEFQDLVAKIAREEGVPRTEAAILAKKRNPELLVS